MVIIFASAMNACVYGMYSNCIHVIFIWFKLSIQAQLKEVTSLTTISLIVVITLIFNVITLNIIFSLAILNPQYNLQLIKHNCYALYHLVASSYGGAPCGKSFINKTHLMVAIKILTCSINKHLLLGTGQIASIEWLISTFPKKVPQSQLKKKKYSDNHKTTRQTIIKRN